MTECTLTQCGKGKPIKSPATISLLISLFNISTHLPLPMASIIPIFFLLFISSFSASSASSASRHHHTQNSRSLLPAAAGNSLIQEACKASRDPPTCQTTLTQSGHVPPNPTVADIIQSALGVSSDGIKKAESMVTDILNQSTGNLNRTNAAKSCLELLNYATYRIDSTSAAIPNSKIKDARAWVSAAMLYEYDCWGALKYVNGTSKVNETMAFLYGLIGSSSDAAAMIVNLDNFGNQTASWGPVKTERDGFWEGAGGSLGSPFTGEIPAGLKPDVSVCGSGCQFTKVQDAVNAAPNDGTGRFVIYIKAGVYQETVRVPLEKKNVVFLGDGMGKTVITGSLNVGLQPGTSTLNSATVGVIGDGFMASGLTIQNTAGPDAHQAVAFRSDSDRSIIENCEFLGNQDTLYAHALRQYYKSCRIQGNIDFIFGNSAAFFQDCIILVAPRQINPEKGDTNAVTAHGRIDPAQSTGFVFNNCLINGTSEYMALYYAKPSIHKTYLGRPWKQYSRTVFIHCTFEALINSDGWLPWDGDFALQTLYYGEFENTGRGANTLGRVPWSCQIPAEHVDSYSVKNFIQGDEWINPTSS